MKLIFILLALIWYVHGFSEEKVENEWNNFQIKYNRSYASKVEAATRFRIFKDNLKKITDHNFKFTDGKVSYTKSINKFGDWTAEEFMDYVNRYERPRYEEEVSVFKKDPNFRVPDSVDWRSKGCVTDVKDQGSCGSCWAFSTTGSLEGQIAIEKGQLISMSEQNLMDCSWSQGNAGCGGGLMRSAFDYIKQNGLESENDYPYLGFDAECKFEKNKSVASISGYTIISKSEVDLQAAVASQGPISVAIDATSELQFYSGGIFVDESCSPYALNHGVLLVGYVIENGIEIEDKKGQNYYIVKNSWGADWGDGGFFLMGGVGENPCGIMQDTCYPNVI